MKVSGRGNRCFSFFAVFFIFLFGAYGSAQAAPVVEVDPTLIPIETLPTIIIPDIPWEAFQPFSIVNVTDNDVDDKCPSLNNGYAFWYRKGDGFYKWQTSQPVSSASKAVNASDCGLLSSYNETFAYNSWFTIKYWDGSLLGTVTSGDALGVSVYGDSIAYSWADGSDFEIVIQKGVTKHQITNDSVWDTEPSLYNDTVAWVHDYLGVCDIWYWDGHNKIKVTSSTQPEEGPSLYDGKIAWFGYDGNDEEIYYWNGSTITQITNDNEDIADRHPSLYDGKIAWERKTANGWEIFYWDGSSVKQITNNSEDDRYPSLYNGAILWTHYDGHDWEIQYAEVDVPQAPSVSTLAASDVTQTTANINGSVNPNGQATTYHFEWGTSTSYDHVTPDKNAGAGSSSVNVYEGLTGLVPGTTYHYRLTAVNPSGTTQGGDRTFTTESPSVVVPVVSTGEADNVTATSARLTGTVNPSGADTQYRFEYGGNSTSYGSHTGWISAGNGSSPLDIAVDVGGLSPGTTYHYRLVAKNSAGTVNGDDKTFTTKALENPEEDMAQRFTGWWYNKNEPGTGVAMQIRGHNIFLAWFVYDENGTSTWYASGGSMANETAYTGELRKWTGWPWGQDYSTPTSEVVGTVTVVFNKGINDAVIFTASVGSSVTTETLTGFMKDFSPGDMDSRRLTGWWWDPSFDGMGFFLDARGGKMAMVWYNYRDDNSPRWWTSDGDFADGAVTYSDSLDGWQNGQCPGCSYKVPTMLPDAGGSINITFIDDSHATLINNGITVHLERFDF